jgi:hypothetical protein
MRRQSGTADPDGKGVLFRSGGAADLAAKLELLAGDPALCR